MALKKKVAAVQFAPWDKNYYFSYAGLNLKIGDEVIVETELGLELGTVINLTEIDRLPVAGKKNNTRKINSEEISATAESVASEVDDLEMIKPVLRKAAASDFEKIPDVTEKKEALTYCQEVVQKLALPMKLVDVHFSMSGNRINFAFASDGRVDFRQLVKELTGHFNANIRLTQIGSRDEARLNGDCGHCGRGLCCRGSIKDFSSITSEMAECQQVVHRGSDRISGQCGRLMCCLAYEYEGYQEMAKKLPPLGAKVNVDGRRGEVISHHVLKQSVDVKFPGEKGEGYVVIEVDLNRHNKKA